MEFSWDRKKARVNARKHGVSFLEASSVFGDIHAITFDDPDHSNHEHRMLTFGMSKIGRLLIVSHTERHGTMRIISARKLTKRERAIYENG